MRTLGIEEAAEILRRGGIVAMPTETVYGLAADAAQPDAIAKVFEAKGRPASHPLIVHLADPDEIARGWARSIPPAAQRLGDLLWPGPLTLILARGPRALDAITGGLDTVAIRLPAHPIARALITAAGALVAPSANRFGSVSPTRPEHVRADLEGRIEGVIDGGPCAIGIESTIVDLSAPIPTLLRPGGVAIETIEEILGAPLALAGEGSPRAPGMLASHYAPRARVIAAAPAELSERARELGGPIAILSIDDPKVPGATWIAMERDPAARARSLYGRLRSIDELGLPRAIVELPHEEGGLERAIADRVRRAAAPR